MISSTLVLVGGALGAVCRYLLGLWVLRFTSNSPLPIAMLIVNGVGSLALGFTVGLSIQELGFILLTDKPVLLFWSVGFLGAFTTFSTFSVEAIGLWREERMRAFFVYTSLTMLVTILGFNLGLYLLP